MLNKTKALLVIKRALRNDKGSQSPRTQQKLTNRSKYKGWRELHEAQCRAGCHPSCFCPPHGQLLESTDDAPVTAGFPGWRWEGAPKIKTEAYIACLERSDHFCPSANPEAQLGNGATSVDRHSGMKLCKCLLTVFPETYAGPFRDANTDTSWIAIV